MAKVRFDQPVAYRSVEPWLFEGGRVYDIPEQQAARMERDGLCSVDVGTDEEAAAEGDKSRKRRRLSGGLGPLTGAETGA